MNDRTAGTHMNISLKDKVIIVTGAASGMGRSSALLFASCGAKVVLTDVHEEQGAQARRDVVQQGGEAIFVAADVSVEADVKKTVTQTLARFGRLDGAFNNAGIEQSLRPLHEIETAQWQRLIGINLTGVFFCMKHQIPAMLANGGGAIVNTASSGGQVAIPLSAEYVASKHGVVGLTRSAALDYAGSNIRVNAVLPGVTQTPMLERGPVVDDLGAMIDKIKARIPMARGGRADEIAQAAAWLLSDAASYVTGALLPVDGGYLIV